MANSKPNLLDPETPQLKPGIPLNAFYLEELLQRMRICNERFSKAVGAEEVSWRITLVSNS